MRPVLLTKLFTSLAGLAMLGAQTASGSSDRPATATASAAINSEACRAIAERAASLLEKRYVFPPLGARYAAQLRRNAGRGDYDGFVDPALLAARLTTDLQTVSPDGHLRLYRVDPTTAPTPSPSPATSAPTGPIMAREGERSIAPGIRAMRWIEPGVAYISFEHFDDRPDAIAAVARFLKDYASAKALIIDSRENHGGAFDMLKLFANTFFSRPRLLANMDMSRSVVEEFGAPFPVDGKSVRRTTGPGGLVRFQHWAAPVAPNSRWTSIPIYYLTSRQTYSAAEHMAMVLKASGRATLIGETTGGGNHFGGTEPVGGGLELFVPIGRTTDPTTGSDWEGKGIAPSVNVPSADALTEALRRIRLGVGGRK